MKTIEILVAVSILWQASIAITDDYSDNSGWNWLLRNRVMEKLLLHEKMETHIRANVIVQQTKSQKDIDEYRTIV